MDIFGIDINVRVPDGDGVYRTQPVRGSINKFAMHTYVKRPVKVQAKKMDAPFDVETLEGVMHGNAGDYLVIGTKGEQYPCKPDIFEAIHQIAPQITYGGTP